jgi:hypothetical protein
MSDTRQLRQARQLPCRPRPGSVVAPRDCVCAMAATVARPCEKTWMRLTQLLSAIGVGLWSVMAAGSQATDAGALSGALRAHVQGERFGIVTSIRGLPLGVRDGLQTLFGSRELDIAEAGAEFQATDNVVNPKLPTRRLVAAGCSTDHCLVYYERGGINHTWHVALLHWTPAATRFEWGGTAPGGLATIEDVRSAVLSNGVNGRARFW